MPLSALSQESPAPRPSVAFVSPFPREGSGGAIWSVRIEEALARSTKLEVLRLADRNHAHSLLARVIRRARTYGLERAFLIRPWIHRQVARGVERFVVDSTNLGWVAAEIRRLSPSSLITVFAHNVEAQYMKGRDDVKGSLACMHRLLLVACERSAARAANEIVFLTHYDRRLFRRLYQPNDETSVVPIALEPPASGVGGEREVRCLARPRLLFVGSDYFANRAALRWLAESLPTDADIEVVVAGRVAPPAIARPQLKFHGYVADLAALYGSCTAALVPVRLGGGMKVKVAEALSFGVPVITTPSSARGYEAAVSAGVVRVFRGVRELLALAREWHREPPDGRTVRSVFDRLYSTRGLPEVLRRLVKA
jgi:glycosyltransferase involved in cell wall biosynthesis